MPRPAPQIDRVVAVINVLAGRDDGASLTELAAALGESQSTMVHVLAALTSAGYLIREDDRRYHLGPALVEPGRVAAARYPALAIARRHMDRLSRTHHAPCFAFVRDRRWARLVHYTRDPVHPFPSMRIGELIPVVPPLCGVFMAWAPAIDVDEWLAADPTLPPARARDLRRALLAVRRAGYLVEGQPREGLGDPLFQALEATPSPSRDRELARLLSDGDRDGEGYILTALAPSSTYLATGIGAPIFGASGTVEITMTLSTYDRALTGREIRAIGTEVRAAADAATAELGGHEPAPRDRRR